MMDRFAMTIFFQVQIEELHNTEIQTNEGTTLGTSLDDVTKTKSFQSRIVLWSSATWSTHPLRWTACIYSITVYMVVAGHRMRQRDGAAVFLALVDSCTGTNELTWIQLKLTWIQWRHQHLIFFEDIFQGGQRWQMHVHEALIELK